MIALRRPNVTPPTLRASGKGAAAALALEQSRAMNPDATLEFEPHWQELDVHGVLYAMQGWVCAYCQRRLDPRDPKHVDHFRPKRGGYWWLAYVPGNYLFSCSLCNGRKGERFPLDGGAARLTYETRERVIEEARLLIDPTVDPVDQWLSVEMEEEKDRYGDVVARPLDPDSLAARRVQETIRLFELNDDVDHLRDRVRLLEELTRMHKNAQLEALRRRASRYCEHSLTARSFLDAYEPDLLPEATEELRWFLEALCTRLKEALDLAKRRDRMSGSSRRRATEILWALAVLWKDPPVGTPEDVARCLEEMGCRKRVERFYTRLA